MEREICFVHISDSHVGGTEDYIYNGTAPLPGFRLALEAVAELPCHVDFVVHTGDVCGDKVNHATKEAYELMNC